jgi:hypothetical protein
MHPAPPKPMVPSPPYRYGEMLPGYVYNEQGVDKGWKISRLANQDWRTMRPAHEFERFEDLAEQIPPGRVWMDPDQPALPELSFPVEWRQPEDAGENAETSCSFMKAPAGSIDPMDPNDIKQGAIGDCWFMAAASTVAMEDSLDDRWLGRYDEDKGIYEFIFYEENDFTERRVCVDRFLPLRKLHPLPPGYMRGDGFPGDYRYCLCKSGTPGELWPSLIEKAIAKLYGSYDNIVGGLSAIGIANLVRGVPYSFKYGNDPLPEDPDVLWGKLVRMWNDGFLMGIGWKEAPEAGVGGPCGEPAAPFGLIAGHAYGILGLYKSRSTGLRFVKIRNPHATNEWKGPWSDVSEELRLNPQVLRECDIDAVEDDGIFLMRIADVIRYGEGLEGVDGFDHQPKGRLVAEH